MERLNAGGLSGVPLFNSLQMVLCASLCTYAFQACALDAQHNITCWGDGYLPDRFSSGRPYATMAIGGSHICALDLYGGLDCFWFYEDGYDVPEGSFFNIFAGSAQTCVL